MIFVLTSVITVLFFTVCPLVVVKCVTNSKMETNFLIYAFKKYVIFFEFLLVLRSRSLMVSPHQDTFLCVWIRAVVATRKRGPNQDFVPQNENKYSNTVVSVPSIDILLLMN